MLAYISIPPQKINKQTKNTTYNKIRTQEMFVPLGLFAGLHTLKWEDRKQKIEELEGE